MNPQYQTSLHFTSSSSYPIQTTYTQTHTSLTSLFVTNTHAGKGEKKALAIISLISSAKSDCSNKTEKKIRTSCRLQGIKRRAIRKWKAFSFLSFFATNFFPQGFCNYFLFFSLSLSTLHKCHFITHRKGQTVLLFRQNIIISRKNTFSYS